MLFVFAIVFLAVATEAYYYVKILSLNYGMGGELYGIITFDNASVPRKDIWDKVNKNEYVTYRRTNGYENKYMSLQIIAPGKKENIDSKTATADMLHIEGAEIVLEMTKNEDYVASILDIDSTMLLDRFTFFAKTVTLERIWSDADINCSRSIWKSITEIRVEAPGHPTQTITRQTPGHTEVQVENAKFFVKFKAVQGKAFRNYNTYKGVTHMAPFWKSELSKKGKLPFKAHKYTGIFSFLDTHLTVQEIWNAVENEVVSANNQGSIVTLKELRIELAKGTKSLEVKWDDVKDNANKLDVTTITDVVYGVHTVEKKNRTYGKLFSRSWQGLKANGRT